MLMPPLMNNHGNYIVSLGNVCRWLGAQAEALGVEIYPGFAASEVLYNDKGAVIGVATGDMGVAEDGEPGPAYPRHGTARQICADLAEGVRGSLASSSSKNSTSSREASRAEVRHRPEGTLAGRPSTTSPASSSIRSAGRSA
jgi:electron-transferring-flavoprotein dehydrogenase